jgi:hypothetical protein
MPTEVQSSTPINNQPSLSSSKYNIFHLYLISTKLA